MNIAPAIQRPANCLANSLYCILKNIQTTNQLENEKSF